MRGEQQPVQTLAVPDAYQGLHHVWLVVAEGLCSVEDICHVVTLEHLQDHGGGTVGAAPAAPVPGGRSTRGGGRRMAPEHHPAPSTSPRSLPIPPSQEMSQSPPKAGDLDWTPLGLIRATTEQENAFLDHQG